MVSGDTGAGFFKKYSPTHACRKDTDEEALTREQNLEFKVEILGELKAMREEFTAHQGAHDRQQDTLDGHEERITSLEASNL